MANDLLTAAILAQLGNKVSASVYEGHYDGVDLTQKFASEIANFSDEWAWLSNRAITKNYTGLYVHDYIVVNCTDNTIIKPKIAGMGVYTGAGGSQIGGHIDMISEDCWPTTIQYNKVNYNNGIGCDKFTGDGSTTEFQCCHRSASTFPTVSSVTVGGTATSDYSYDASTGKLTFTTAPASGAVIKAIWSNAIICPFMASNLRAYLMSEKCGVPNEAAADPSLIEVDYTNSGVWAKLPTKLKNVIADKLSFPGCRYTAGTLRTSEDSYWNSVNLGKLWVPDEVEVYGHQVHSTEYSSAFGRRYPMFFNGNWKAGAGDGGYRAGWWLLPAFSGSSTHACDVNSIGYAYSNTASNTGIRSRVCFRLA